MAPPRGLTQVSDTIYEIPNVARSRVTLCTGLKVGHIIGHSPNTTIKLESFFSNIPFVAASPSNNATKNQEAPYDDG